MHVVDVDCKAIAQFSICVRHCVEVATGDLPSSVNDEMASLNNLEEARPVNSKTAQVDIESCFEPLGDIVEAARQEIDLALNKGLASIFHIIELREVSERELALIAKGPRVGAEVNG